MTQMTKLLVYLISFNQILKTNLLNTQVIIKLKMNQTKKNLINWEDYQSLKNNLKKIEKEKKRKRKKC